MSARRARVVGCDVEGADVEGTRWANVVRSDAAGRQRHRWRRGGPTWREGEAPVSRTLGTPREPGTARNSPIECRWRSGPAQSAYRHNPEQKGVACNCKTIADCDENRQATRRHLLAELWKPQGDQETAINSPSERGRRVGQAQSANRHDVEKRGVACN